MLNLGKIEKALPAPNGFRVITVGTGAPHYDKDRASACTLVQYQDTSILVDLGYRSVSRMLDAGMDAFSIPNVLFTHCLHLDHTLDYGYFMGMAYPFPQPLNLYGPPGTQRLHDSFFRLYEEQLSMVVRNGRPKQIRVCEIGDGDSFRIDNVLVHTKEVPHVVQDIAYRFDAGGKRIVVPGDMSFSEEFIDFASDADLIVFDTNTAPSEFMDEMRKRMAERGLAPDKSGRPPGMAGGDAHATLAEIADMAERARARAILLTHFTRGPKIRETVQQLSEIYHGEIIAGEDMLAVEI